MRPAPRFVSYLRVSTTKQGANGLGVEAQREAVRSYVSGAVGEGASILREYVETESGKRNDRPQLQAAIEHCSLAGARLVIAKLDRLSRNAAFMIGLRDAGVDFVAADMPQADSFTVGILALVAERERDMISQRTKAALAVAKRRGTKLGNPNGAAHLRGRGNARRRCRGSRRSRRDSRSLSEGSHGAPGRGRCVGPRTGAGI